MAVMKIVAARFFYPELLTVGLAESLGIAAGKDDSISSHDSHLLIIPAERIHHRPVAAVKMSVVHQQPLHGRIIQLAFHRCAHRRHGVLVQHLVALNVNAPVAGALAQRPVRVM